MLWGGEAGTSSFVHTQRTHVAGRVRKLAHIKQVHFYVLAGIVCQGSVHNTTLQIEVILFLFGVAQIQTI